MKLKICGMKYPQNIEDVSIYKPDFMGFIFYPESKRFVKRDEIADLIKTIDNDIRSVGVFVDQPLSEVIGICNDLHLDYAQLHGNESPEYIAKLKLSGNKVIKVFHINQDFKWSKCKKYVCLSDYFLFDTATSTYGGSGKQFNWELLKEYKEEIPFFLSGGIDLEDLTRIKELQIPYLAGIDVNSRFEQSTGIKDLEKIQHFKNELTNEYELSRQ